MMEQAMGVLELCGTPTAIVAADIMAKAAHVAVVGIENTDGGRISVVIQGRTGDVQAALSAAIADLSQQPGATVMGHHCIPYPAGMAGSVFAQWRSSASAEDVLGWLDD